MILVLEYLESKNEIFSHVYRKNQMLGVDHLIFLILIEIITELLLDFLNFFAFLKFQLMF